MQGVTGFLSYLQIGDERTGALNQKPSLVLCCDSGVSLPLSHARPARTFVPLINPSDSCLSALLTAGSAAHRSGLSTWGFLVYVG